MANNYTVSSLETPTGIIETPGDNVSNSTPSYVLTLTPDLGYAITHSNFTANSLPTEISNVVFTQNGELVVATVNFASNFVMPQSNVNLQIDIDGSAQLKNYTIHGLYSTVQENTTDSSVTNVVYSNNGNYATSEVLFTKTFTASSTSGTGFTGYYFEEEPYISSSNIGLYGEESSYTITTSKTLTNGLLTAKTFTVSYKYPAENVSGHTIGFVAKAVEIWTETPKITNYKIITTALSKFGESRKLRIYGSPGAKFDLTISKNGSDTYDFTTETFTSTATLDDDRALSSDGYYDYAILFPGDPTNLADGSITQDNNYTITIAAGTATTLSLAGGLASTFDLKQSLDKSVTISVINSGSTVYTISPSFIMTGPVGVVEPDGKLFSNTFTVAYSSAINIISQPVAENFVSVPANPGNTDLAIASVTLAQGATNTVNVVVPGYVYEFGDSNVQFNLDVANFISVVQNTQPVATAQTRGVTSGVGKSLALAGTDAEGSTLTFAIATNPLYGTLTNFNANNGFVVYTSNSGYSGSDSFTFTVNDGALTSTAATVTLNVTAQAIAPTSTETFAYRVGNTGNYTQMIGSFVGEASYNNLTAGSSTVTVTVTSFALDSIHGGYPSFADGFEDFDIAYEFKHGNTTLNSGPLFINQNTSTVGSYGAFLNLDPRNIAIPNSHNSGNGLIAGASYSLHVNLTYLNN